MVKKLTLLFVIITIFFLNTTSAIAAAADGACNKGDTCNSRVDGTPESCQQDSTGIWTCKPDTFGKVQPPPALIPFLQNDTTGAKGISKFLSNLVALIYTMSAIAVVFMLVWGAFDWLTSGGNKEQLERARSRIINAIIGILLLAAAFAILDVLHIFTGFKFFSSSPSNSTQVNCQNGGPGC